MGKREKEKKEKREEETGRGNSRGENGTGVKQMCKRREREREREKSSKAATAVEVGELECRKKQSPVERVREQKSRELGELGESREYLEREGRERENESPPQRGKRKEKKRKRRRWSVWRCLHGWTLWPDVARMVPEDVHVFWLTLGTWLRGPGRSSLSQARREWYPLVSYLPHWTRTVMIIPPCPITFQIRPRIVSLSLSSS